MFVPSNALKLLELFINETDNSLRKIPRNQVIGYTEKDRREDLYEANVRFIKGFHQFLASLFNIDSANFKYITYFDDTLPRIIHDEKPGIPFRLLLKYWNTDVPNFGPVTIELPRELGDIVQSLDIMNQDRGTPIESILPLQVSYFGLTHFRKFCSVYLGKKDDQLDNSEKKSDAPPVLVSNLSGVVYIGNNKYSYPDRIRKAVAFMLESHFKSKKYFDRIDLLKYIGVSDLKKSLRDLFKYHEPLFDYVNKAKDRRMIADNSDYELQQAGRMS